MARKVVSRKGKRAAAASAKTKKKKAATKKAAPKKAVAKKAATKKAAAKKAVAKKKPTKRRSRAKSAKHARMKAYWGVFNQALKRVALFEFNEKKKADKKAKELSASGKSPHFVQPVKEPVVED